MAKFPPVSGKPSGKGGYGPSFPPDLALKFKALLAKKKKAKGAKAVAGSKLAPTATAKERALNPLSVLIARDKKRAKPVGRK